MNELISNGLSNKIAIVNINQKLFVSIKKY